MKKGKKPFVSFDDVHQARLEISKYLEPSPLLYNQWLSEAFDCKIYLKLENMQPIGSFKIRGATYKISQLSEKEKKRGVIAASAGNHAQGVAWGSRQLGVKSLIVMPKSAPLVKIKNTESFGAEVVLEGDNYDEAFQAAARIAKETGRVYVHAFDDPQVIAGQGTVALEIFDQLPDVDMIVASIGGGGLMSGIAVVRDAVSPKVKLVGAQATGADSMLRSLKKGRPTEIDKVSTFADGIAVRKIRESTFHILKNSLDLILEADDEAIAAAILTLAEKAKMVTEGAAAVSLAVLDQIKKKLKGKKVVIVICGGNIDVNVLNRVFDRGLIRKGRRLRVNVTISDRPGSLAKLTAVIAEAGANVIQAIHDRSEPGVTIDRTEVALTLETRGAEHSLEVLDVLKKFSIGMEVQ